MRGCSRWYAVERRWTQLSVFVIASPLAAPPFHYPRHRQSRSHTSVPSASFFLLLSGSALLIATDGHPLTIGLVVIRGTVREAVTQMDGRIASPHPGHRHPDHTPPICHCHSYPTSTSPPLACPGHLSLHRVTSYCPCFYAPLSPLAIVKTKRKWAPTSKTRESS